MSMVDAIVLFAVQRLSDFLIGEVAFSSSVEDKLEWLKNELTIMQSFLKDADEKQDGDERIRMWISEIRDIAYEIEDVIDTFLLRVTGKFSFILKKVNIYKLGTQIEVLRERVLDLSRKRGTYGINNIGDLQEGASDAICRQRHLRRTTSYADEEHVVGFEDDARLLETKLLIEEPRRSVISILGMGGLGKTTLARKLYNDSNIKHAFDCSAWVCVSQEWRPRDLLERTIKSFKKLSKDELEMLEKMNAEDLERYLRDELEGHRYLVVIDDVWRTDAWESLSRALPDKKNKSRIIITTRNKDVAELVDERAYVHQLRFLRPDESWKLFCWRAFSNYTDADANTHHCPPSLQKLGEEMVAKCEGLPLAIIVLGGLLSRKQPHEWLAVKEHIWRELERNSTHIQSILALSFKDLPYQLKPCFLYLGHFPEDFVINSESLIRLWVAEGFVSQEEEALDLDEVAEGYLKELIGRSLIQVAKRNWRTVTACRVHDLLRDLAVSKAKDLNFLYIYDGILESSTRSTSKLKYRRVASHSGFKRFASLHHSNANVRTLLFLDREVNIKTGDLALIHNKFRLLRVLELEGIYFLPSKGKTRLPDVVGELIHLRYLGLKRTKIDLLPRSIGKLQALETLVASYNHEIRLPRQILKLKQLKHLIGSFSTPLRLDALTNLQILKYIDIFIWFMTSPEKLINLRELRITYDSEKAGVLNSTFESIAKLSNLKFLSVRSHLDLPSIQPLLQCRELIELRIRGRIRDLPGEMHEFLPNLKYLELNNSQLQQDPMPILEMLPNLIVLTLVDNRLEVMSCTASGFPQLEVLQIVDIHLAKITLQMEEGAMPRLRAFSISDGEHVLPERLKSLPHVDDLNWEWDQISLQSQRNSLRQSVYWPFYF